MVPEAVTEPDRGGSDNRVKVRTAKEWLTLLFSGSLRDLLLPATAPFLLLYLPSTPVLSTWMSHLCLSKDQHIPQDPANPFPILPFPSHLLLLCENLYTSCLPQDTITSGLTSRSPPRFREPGPAMGGS